ncbi:MAG: metallopeptidase family protein [Candidatus Pacebacteria bacterium]|nr:metallopeptidase family protein [Candidatus Paceibacterota bacterium]
MLTEEGFKQLVEEGIKDIPERILKNMGNVEICIEEEPNSFQVKRLKERGNVLGLYEGVPKNIRCSYCFILPDKITIFRKPIERMAKDKEDLKRIVKDTVWHEIAHHFGFSEEGVRNLSSKRNKNEN